MGTRRRWREINVVPALLCPGHRDLRYMAGNTGSGLACCHAVTSLNTEQQDRRYLRFTAGKTETPIILPRDTQLVELVAAGSKPWPF